ncbi:MAG: hypothetical protein QOE94_2159 [Mycobacterium sp.]|nr:hypothetical protein [Mycobacterium sp.]
MIAVDWCHGASLGPAWLEAEGHRILKLNIGNRRRSASRGCTATADRYHPNPNLANSLRSL